jgi:hypothetical protein
MTELQIKIESYKICLLPFPQAEAAKKKSAKNYRHHGKRIHNKNPLPDMLNLQ